jgi:hypothetical protein
VNDLAAPRFCALAAGAGGYESYYLKAGAPDGGRAVWIRYTVHKRPDAQPEGSLWLTLFDRDGRPRAVKQTAAEPPELLDGGYLRIGALGSFAPGRARGAITGAGRSAAWELEVAGDAPPLLHLPHRLYGAPLPRTKLLTLRPEAVFSGSVEFDGERVALESWPGMVGHNWGAQHAEQWVWLHGACFEGLGRSTWLDVALGRIRIGRWTTPWVANGALCIAGMRHRLGGLGRTRGVRAWARPGSCEFVLPGERVTVRGSVHAPAAETAAWRYADPDGSEHHTLNCSIADLRLQVDGRELVSTGGAVYEYGSRDTTHGIPVEPFADG